MQALCVAGVLVLLAAVTVITVRALRAPKPVLTTIEDVKYMHERVAGVLAIAIGRGDVPVIVELIRSTAPFLHRAKNAVEFNRPMRARLHLNLVSIALAWAETVLESRRHELPRMVLSNQLALGLALLERNNYEAAKEEFEKVWLNDHAHVNAKRVAIMARIWIHASLGEHQDAAETEQLLILFPHVVQMEGVDLTCTISREND